jgi:hypothetical protein
MRGERGSSFTRINTPEVQMQPMVPAGAPRAGASAMSPAAPSPTAATDRRSRQLNDSMALLAILAVGLAIANFALNWDHDAQRLIYVGTWATFVKIAISVVTLVHLALLRAYYALRLRTERQRWSGIEGSERLTLAGSRFFARFLFESLLILLHAPPFLDFEITSPISGEQRPFLTDKLNLAIFLRLYCLARCLRDRHTLFVSRETYLRGRFLTHSLCRTKYESTLFVLRAYYNDAPIAVTSVVSFFAYVVLGFAIWVSEREKDPVNFNLENSYWFTYVTFSTVGYGDLTVSHDLSRFLALVTSLFGIISTSTMVGALALDLGMDSSERGAVAWGKRHDKAGAWGTAAAVVVQRWWRRLKARKFCASWGVLCSVF